MLDRLIAWWTRGPYSHAELIVYECEDGTALSYSSSIYDQGVRKKIISYDPDKWDFIDLDGIFDSDSAMCWFEQRLGMEYDIPGVFGFVIRRVEEDRYKYFCSGIS